MFAGFFKSLSGAVAVSFLTTVSASATSVSLSYVGTVSGYRTVTIQETPVIPVANPVSAGAFYMNDTSGTLGTFIAWCLDLTNYTTAGGPFPFTVTSSPFSNSYGLGVNDRARVQAYFDANYYDGLASDQDRSAGFQMGLWEVLYDDDFSLTADTLDTQEFRARNGTDYSTNTANWWANQFLSMADGYTDSQKWNLKFLENDAGTKQNLVTVSAVPLPAAGLLLFGALAGLGLAVGRRKT